MKSLAYTLSAIFFLMAMMALVYSAEHETLATMAIAPLGIAVILSGKGVREK